MVMNQTNAHSRREFLQTTAGLVLAAGFSGACSSVPRGAQQTKHWTVACRDAHLKATGQPDCWAALKFLGIAGVEVDVTPDMLCPALYHQEKKYSLATDAGVQELSGELAARGVTITAFCMHNHFDDRLEDEVAWMRKLVPVAQAMNIKTIRIDVAPHKTPVDQFLPVAIKACKAVCEINDGRPVRYAIENHSRFTNDPAVLDQLFAGVGSPQLGLTLDALNFYWFGWPLEEVYGMYERFASRVLHTHCKNVRYPADQRNIRRPMGWEYAKYAAPIYEGDIDYKRVVAILRKANYQGDLCLENECLKHFPPAEQPGVLRKEIAMLQSLA
jgi:sugar phosphate isomerase/epimerase